MDKKKKRKKKRKKKTKKRKERKKKTKRKENKAFFLHCITGCQFLENKNCRYDDKKGNIKKKMFNFSVKQYRTN